MAAVSDGAAHLEVYKARPHGMATTHPDVINADLLVFFGA